MPNFFKGYDNSNPREFLDKLQGRAKRAHYAQLNSFEAFPAFAEQLLWRTWPIRRAGESDVRQRMRGKTDFANDHKIADDRAKDYRPANRDSALRTKS